MIKVIGATPYPIQHIGKIAGICFNSNQEDVAKNYKRGVECIESNHGRTLEYADVTLEITGFSNRMIRELYTTIVGVSRLQQSTRYVNMAERYEEYYIPHTIKRNDEALKIYNDAMANLKASYENLIAIGIPKEDAGNLVPLGQDTTIILKINVRALMNLYEQRTCTRAYIEYREFMIELRNALSEIDSEWSDLTTDYFITKCDRLGYCPEKKTCGKYPLKADIMIVERRA